jgi:hypothetical protein
MPKLHFVTDTIEARISKSKINNKFIMIELNEGKKKYFYFSFLVQNSILFNERLMVAIRVVPA